MPEDFLHRHNTVNGSHKYNAGDPWYRLSGDVYPKRRHGHDAQDSTTGAVTKPRVLPVRKCTLTPVVFEGMISSENLKSLLAQTQTRRDVVRNVRRKQRKAKRTQHTLALLSTSLERTKCTGSNSTCFKCASRGEQCSRESWPPSSQIDDMEVVNSSFSDEGEFPVADVAFDAENEEWAALALCDLMDVQ